MSAASSYIDSIVMLSIFKYKKYIGQYGTQVENLSEEFLVI